jgi:hypothetical protein
MFKKIALEPVTLRCFKHVPGWAARNSINDKELGETVGRRQLRL